MEPISVASTIGKLLSTGYSVYKAAQGHGADFELDLKAYESLIDLGGQLGGWLPKDSSPREGAQALAVLTLAFGKAYHECFGALRSFDDPKHLQANLTAAVAWAQPAGPSDPQKPPLSLPELLAEPERTPYFASLWSAFTARNLPGKAGRGDIAVFTEPLIETPSGEVRRRFEAAFRRNVAELLSSPSGRDLSVAVLRTEQAAERTRWVERLLVGDMATWHERHVFGNVRGHQTLPPMPLGRMYIEPSACLRKGQRGVGPIQPVRTLLRSLLAAHPLVVVTADFGHGKSLTARTLANQTAAAFLNNGSQTTAELERPVFVRCQTAFSTSNIELAGAVRRAQWLALTNELGIRELAESDEAFSPPSKLQRTLFLLDGLDEVAFLERDCLHFFEQLRGQLTNRHRAVVFSRPHSLPAEKLAEWGVPVLELQPFSTDGDDLGQAGQWLAGWNACSGRSPIEAAALQRDGLVDLARTPILLFMIAYTWGNLANLYAEWEPPESADEAPAAERMEPPTEFEQSEARWDRKHRIYEAFFRAIAWGKYERDCETHPVILRAARALHSALLDRSLLPADLASIPSEEGKSSEAERHTLTQAMLWLMGRVAWHAACLQHQPKPKPLTRSQVDRLLEDELDISDPKTAEVARDGLLLAMQADFSESSRPILFGHQSFREFLIARCWSDLLRVIVDSETPATEKGPLTQILRQAPLREEGSANFDFLRARLRQWPAEARKALHDWAIGQFEDDTVETTPASLRGDTRREFRNTALAIASSVAPPRGLVLRGDDALRSLLASYWIAGELSSLWAPRLQASYLVANGADLHQANFSRANLTRAILDGSDLFGINLGRADLSEARLQGAELATADLERAILHGTILERARLSGAYLRGADLREANLQGADLKRADLQGADLTGANLTRANLARADLTGAVLAGAILQGALLDEVGFALATQAGAIMDETTRVLRRAGDKDRSAEHSAADSDDSDELPD